MNRPLQSTFARRLLFLTTPTTTTTAKRFSLPFPQPIRSHNLKSSPRMSSTRTDSPQSDSLSLSTQPHHPVHVVAAPGVTESHFRTAVESSLFRNWVKNLESEGGILANGAACLKQILIQGVDMFGNRIGFLKFKADIFDNETGKKIPGIVFARGPAVAVLILLYSEDVCYAILTEQARVPAGKMLLELPAGMLDDDKGDFVGTAVRESYWSWIQYALLGIDRYTHHPSASALVGALCVVEEETGIKLNLEDMVDLTSFLDPSTGCRIFPSPGGCDEEISIFLYRGHVKKEIIDQLQGREGGLLDHGELIKVRVVPYDELWRKTPDAKVLMAVALYEMAVRNGLLPPLKGLI